MDGMQVAFFHVGHDLVCPTLLVRSIRKHHSDAMILQCSDFSAPQIEGTDAVHRIEGDVANLMTFRLTCFSRLQIDAPTIFLDTDMLCLQKLDFSAILQDNDIAVCHRQFSTKSFFNIASESFPLPEYADKTLGQAWPYIPCATVTRSSDLWNDCLQNLLQLHPKFHRWYGDQEAIRNVVTSKKYKMAILLESIYACLPEVQPFYGNDVKLLHFKGPDRKSMIIDYAKRTGLLP